MWRKCQVVRGERDKVNCKLTNNAVAMHKVRVSFIIRLLNDFFLFTRYLLDWVIFHNLVNGFDSYRSWLWKALTLIWHLWRKEISREFFFKANILRQKIYFFHLFWHPKVASWRRFLSNVWLVQHLRLQKSLKKLL